MPNQAAAEGRTRSFGGCGRFLGAVLAAALAAVETGAAGGAAVHIDAEPLDGGGQRIEARFRIDASSAAVWEVLTDYENLPRFVSSLKSSRRDPSAAPAVVVEQEGSARFLFVKRAMSVRLLIEERPMERISFRDVSGRDFLSYAGHWHIEAPLAAAAGPVTLRYELEAQPRAGAPQLVKKSVLKRTVRSLLEQVRAEIGKRQRGRSVAFPKSEEERP